MHIRGTILVDYDKWIEFLEWYKKYSNIRVLKIKDKVGHRTVIDKKDKSNVAYEYHRYGEDSYGIYEDWYDKFLKNNL